MLTMQVVSGDPNTILSPQIQALIKSKPPRRILVSAIFLLVTGALIMSLGPDIFKETVIQRGGDTKNWIYRNALPLVGIAKLLGAVLLAWGSYLGFRRLPFKLS